AKDYIIVNRRYKNAVESCKTYPGADIPTDHNLLLARIKVEFKRTKGNKKATIINTDKLKEESTYNKIKEEIHRYINEKPLKPTQTSEEDWQKIKTTLKNVTGSTLSRRPGKRINLG
ncbi:hypothetical protein HHI36_003170, partial [Cryptolaemus montrouzieri]